MELFKIGRDIPFMRHAKIFNAISFITFALAVFFLFTRGLHLSVEFTGGTLMEVSYSQPANLEKVRGTVASLGYAEVQVQNFGTARDVMIRLPVQKGVTTAQQSDRVLQALKAGDAAVVHCLGILTSMFSAVFFSRALVNLWYGRQKKLKSVSIGTVWRPDASTKP